MTDLDLTRLSTLALVVATSALFLLLARWSTGASWGISAGIIDGVRGWSRGSASSDGKAPKLGELPPLSLPTGPAGVEHAAKRPEVATTDLATEIEDLPSRPI